MIWYLIINTIFTLCPHTETIASYRDLYLKARAGHERKTTWVISRLFIDINVIIDNIIQFQSIWRTTWMDKIWYLLSMDWMDSFTLIPFCIGISGISSYYLLAWTTTRIYLFNICFWYNIFSSKSYFPSVLQSNFLVVIEARGSERLSPLTLNSEKWFQWQR